MGIITEKSWKQEKPPAWADGLFPIFFEGGDREWFFIYPRVIISAICEETVSQILKKSKKYEMKIKSDTFLHLSPKCGKVDPILFLHSAGKKFYRVDSAQDNPFFER